MFQFTHPGRGATILLVLIFLTLIVSIHAPREGCDQTGHEHTCRERVSIHAPREGCDIVPDSDYSGVGMFQFTHPGRGATACRQPRAQARQVSIHAPREGCDPNGEYR